MRQKIAYVESNYTCIHIAYYISYIVHIGYRIKIKFTYATDL